MKWLKKKRLSKGNFFFFYRRVVHIHDMHAACFPSVERISFADRLNHDSALFGESHSTRFETFFVCNCRTSILSLLIISMRNDKWICFFFFQRSPHSIRTQLPSKTHCPRLKDTYALLDCNRLIYLTMATFWKLYYDQQFPKISNSHWNKIDCWLIKSSRYELHKNKDRSELVMNCDFRSTVLAVTRSSHGRVLPALCKFGLQLEV